LLDGSGRRFAASVGPSVAKSLKRGAFVRLQGQIDHGQSGAPGLTLRSFVRFGVTRARQAQRQD